MKADSLSFLALITKLQGHSAFFKNTPAVVYARRAGISKLILAIIRAQILEVYRRDERQVWVL